MLSAVASCCPLSNLKCRVISRSQVRHSARGQGVTLAQHFGKFSTVKRTSKNEAWPPSCIPTFCLRSSAEKREGQAQVEEKPAGRKRKRPGKGKDAELLGGEGQGWGATLQHVNLFSEAEREAGKLLGQNADHQREKQEQDLKAQQRSGLAPTALGEGAAELKDKDSQPWYTQVEASSRAPKVAARAVRLGREVTGEEAEAVMKRDDGRKARADPLSSLFRSAAQPAARILPQERMGTSLKPRPSVATSLGEDAGKSEGATARSESDKRSKKSKKDKKDKKHKKKSSKRRRGSSDRDNSRTRGDAAAEAGGSGGDAGSAAELTRRQALVRLGTVVAKLLGANDRSTGHMPPVVVRNLRCRTGAFFLLVYAPCEDHTSGVGISFPQVAISCLVLRICTC